MTPATSRTCVVILNWNQPELTRRCLDHVAAQRNATLETLVIDNGSSPDNRRRLELVCQERCRLILLPANRGFTGGMNVGINYADREGFEFVWLLNNDAFPEPDCLSHLIQAFESNPLLALVTPRLFGSDGREQHAGGQFDWKWMANQNLNAEDMANPRGFGSWLTGTAILGRTKILADLGGLDDRLFAYWEDVDLCFRLSTANHQFRAVCEARCLHLGGASTGNVESPFNLYLCTRNAWHVLRNYVRGSHRTRLGLAYATRSLYNAAHYYALGSKQTSCAVITGLVAGLLRGETGSPHNIIRGSRWFLRLLWIMHFRRPRIELNRLSGFFGHRIKTQSSRNLRNR